MNWNFVRKLAAIRNPDLNFKSKVTDLFAFRLRLKTGRFVVMVYLECWKNLKNKFDGVSFLQSWAFLIVPVGIHRVNVLLILDARVVQKYTILCQVSCVTNKTIRDYVLAPGCHYWHSSRILCIYGGFVRLLIVDTENNEYGDQIEGIGNLTQEFTINTLIVSLIEITSDAVAR